MSRPTSTWYTIYSLADKEKAHILCVGRQPTGESIPHRRDGRLMSRRMVCMLPPSYSAEMGAYFAGKLDLWPIYYKQTKKILQRGYMIDIDYKYHKSQFCTDRVRIQRDINVFLANLTWLNLTYNGHNLAISSI